MRRTVGREPPENFPGLQFDEINAYVAIAGRARREPWLLFAAAWNAVAFRSIAAEAQAVRYIAALEPKLTFDRFTQDDALFQFSVSSLSAMECFFTAAYCVGALARPDRFSVTRVGDLHFTPLDVANRFTLASEPNRLATLMNGILSDPKFKRLSVLRNVLAHRGTPPRQHGVQFDLGTPGPQTVQMETTIPSNLKALPSEWDYSEPIDRRLVENLQTWRRSALAELVMALHEYVRATIAPRIT